MNAKATLKKISKVEALCDNAYTVYLGEQQKREWKHPNTEREAYKEWLNLVAIRVALRGLQKSQNKLKYELKRTNLKL